MAWLLIGLVVSVLVAAGLLGHLGWLERLAVALWRRVHPAPPHTDNISIEQLAADLRRLAAQLERVHVQDQPAKMERLTAAALAYDWVLLSAARTLDVPAPPHAPLRPLERLETEAALAAQGLDW
jgi:hypothetical protein